MEKEKEEVRSQKQDARREDDRESSSVSGLQRRKILGWMGVGIVGAMAFKALPFKLMSKRGGRRKSAKPDALVAINGMAVKRGKKVSKNV